jgi:hypothetical protein
MRCLWAKQPGTLNRGEIHLLTETRQEIRQMIVKDKSCEKCTFMYYDAKIPVSSSGLSFSVESLIPRERQVLEVACVFIDHGRR